MQNYSYIYTPFSSPLSKNIINNISLQEEVKAGYGVVPWLDKESGYVYVLANNGNKIIVSTDGGKTFKTVKVYSNMRVRAILKLSDGFLLFSGSTGNIHLVDENFAPVSTISNNWSIQTLRSAVSIDYKKDDGIVMFTDYAPDGHPYGKRVWRSTDNGRSFQEVFYDADVRHWHSCQVDPFTGDWWITSGDTADTPGQITKIYKSINDGDSWILVDSGDRKLKGIRLVFTRDKIMWGSDEDAGKSNVMVTSRDTWNPVSIAQLNGPILGNHVTTNGLCMMHMRCESLSEEKDMGRIYITDGETVKEVFSLRNPKPNATGAWGFSSVSQVDMYNRIWIGVQEIGLICISLPFTLD